MRLESPRRDRLDLSLRMFAGDATPRQAKPACQESSAAPGSENGTAVCGEPLHRLIARLVQQKMGAESTVFIDCGSLFDWRFQQR